MQGNWSGIEIYEGNIKIHIVGVQNKGRYFIKTLKSTHL
jgi:hypothetical protein